LPAGSTAPAATGTLTHSEHSVVSLTANGQRAEQPGSQAAGRAGVDQAPDPDSDTDQARLHEARRIWVLDQVQWLRSHDLLC
jgi:hypothetical protein